MADVRKLLQAERRQRESGKQKPTPRASGKRPYSATDDGNVTSGVVGLSSTKRMRTASTNPDLPSGFFDEGSGGERLEGVVGASSRGDVMGEEEEEEDEEEDALMGEAAATTVSSIPADFFQRQSPSPAGVDEDEWAAFQADVVAEPSAAAIFPGSVVITATPTLNSSAGRGDAGQEQDDYGKGEEEDAKQKLLDEFAEMESLERRVLRLKERREALKSKHPIAATRTEVAEFEFGGGGGGQGDKDQDNDEEGDYDDDDFFRARGF